jgi:hypothetical protein
VKSREVPAGAGLAFLAVAVLAGFVAWSWPLATRLSTHVLVHESAGSEVASADLTSAGWALILANDQNVSMWGAANNARALLRGDWDGLLQQGLCYPMPRSGTLGEHMIELGALGAPWWLLSGDPVTTYNLALLTALVIGASGMFLFLHLHTGSVAAAVVGALAFAFSIPRLADLPYHPAVVGTHWLPWVLWSFDRVLGGRSRGAAVWFAVALLMSAMVGSYPLLAVTFAGACYGIVAVVQRRRRGELPSAALVRCAAAALPAVVLTMAVLLSYVHVQREWLLRPTAGAKFVVDASEYLPGGLFSVGIASLLGLVPLVLWRGGPGRRATAGLVAVALGTFLVATALPLPGGVRWSFYEALASRIALFDSVRAPGKVGLAVCFALQALGAIGWSRCMAVLGGRARTALATFLVLLVALEASPPGWARGTLGTSTTMTLREIAPPPATIEAMVRWIGDADDDLAVLDLPTGRMVRAPLALRDAAYHGHPTSACYSSLFPPTLRVVEDLIARSHSADGVEELAASGFGYIIERPRSAAAPLSSTSFPRPAELLVFEEEVAIWRLPAVGNVHHDVAKLAIEIEGGATRPDTFAPEPPHEIDLVVTNGSEEMWMAPRPVQPLFADVELVSDDGKDVFRSQARGVLPLALAPGRTSVIKLVMPDAPEPGHWRATLRITGVAAPIVSPTFSWLNERG